jgi:hypothetical protein
MWKGSLRLKKASATLVILDERIIAESLIELDWDRKVGFSEVSAAVDLRHRFSVASWLEKLG